MADTVINTTTIAPFIPQIWANEALEILRNNIVLAPLVTKDTDVASFNQGDTLHIPYPGTLVANDKVQNQPVTKQAVNPTDTVVKLDKHKEVTILLEDFAKAIAQPLVSQEYVKAAVIALAEKVETDLFSLYSSFSGSLGTAGTDLDAAVLRAVNKKFTDNKVPRGNRHLIVSTKDSASLLGDESLQTFFSYNAARGDITNGLIAQDVYGLQLHESQLVPSVAGTPTATDNLALDPGAIILASRALPMAPAGSGVSQAVVSDPQSGVTLRCTMGYDKDALGVQTTFDILYGVNKLRDEKGFVVLS
ncbi:P22 phage major capsid protein family protein [Bifidobacterium aquikefiri]|uniref:P22 phage major capsid protein family protein n=1 Tax=Bifidobacterium aquikefiri TaxID=1653207 RepID=UPI0039EC7E09